MVCGACSSKKFVLAHQSAKPLRVCDSCYVKYVPFMVTQCLLMHSSRLKGRTASTLAHLAVDTTRAGRSNSVLSNASSGVPFTCHVRIYSLVAAASATRNDDVVETGSVCHHITSYHITSPLFCSKGTLEPRHCQARRPAKTAMLS